MTGPVNNDVVSQTTTPKTVAQVMGEIVWLMTQSQTHKQLFISDLEWFAMPAILLEQFRIFYGPQHPVGVALWAYVSDDTHQRLQKGAFKLRADEWKSGEHPWLVELIAPFGGQDELLTDMAKVIFPATAFSYHTVNETGQRIVKKYNPE